MTFNCSGASHLFPLLATWFLNLGHAMLTALSDRWHEDTSSFHLSVGELTVTMNDVACHLDIPIEWKMLNREEKISSYRGVQLMTKVLGVVEQTVIEEWAKQFCARIIISWLKVLFEKHLIVATNLQNTSRREEKDERDNCGQWRVRGYLLYLLVCIIFTDKNNEHIELMYLETMWDMDKMHE